MARPEDALEQNKAVVLRFNREVIEQGSETAFWELVDPSFVNRTAAPGVSPGPEGMLFMFERVLRPAFPDLHVEIHDQIAEGDKVSQRGQAVQERLTWPPQNADLVGRARWGASCPRQGISHPEERSG